MTDKQTYICLSVSQLKGISLSRLGKLFVVSKLRITNVLLLITIRRETQTA
jgi:hypothetical protein